LSKAVNTETALHKVLKYGRFRILEKLWDWAKEMQLKPEELRFELLLSKDENN
jgi:hypothetical protein